MGLPRFGMGQYPESIMARIVIADDTAPLRLLMKRVLESGRHQVFEAVDGDRALDVLAEHRPDLAVLDLYMPGLDGFEVCRAIRADVRLRDIGVVVISGDDEAEAAANAGADGFLLKPFRPSELLGMVGRLAGARRAPR
jgi:CheY-like chemotaxis protein